MGNGSQPYVGQVVLFPYNFAPVGWMFCNGQVLPISENDTLFNLIGTIYGGDGQSNFNLPDLRGRTPIHMGSNPSTGSNYQIGQSGGVPSVTLTAQQIPNHSHPPVASYNAQSSANPVNNVLGSNGPLMYVPNVSPNSAMANNMLSQVGGSQPHDNQQPYLTLNWCISLFGIFPSQT